MYASVYSDTELQIRHIPTVSNYTKYRYNNSKPVLYSVPSATSNPTNTLTPSQQVPFCGPKKQTGASRGALERGDTAPARALAGSRVTTAPLFQ